MNNEEGRVSTVMPAVLPTRKQGRVLLVEDIPSDAHTITAHLTQGHYRSFEVTLAGGIGQAATALKADTFDAVLVDLSLAEGDDISDLVKLRALAPQLPLVVLTGWSNESAGRKALQNGAADYLPKNELTASALVRVLGNAIDRHRVFWHLREVIARAPDALVVVDGKGKIQLVNRAAMALFHGNAEALLGKGLGFELTAGLVREINLPGKNGENRTAEMRVVDLEWNGEPAHLVSLRDTSRMARLAHDLRAANAALGEMLTTDPLARVLNRKGLERALAVELERLRRTGSNLAAVMVFCDDFRATNDAAARDRIAVAVASQIQAVTRASDHIGRVTDDIFILLLPDTRRAEAAIVAEKLEFALASVGEGLLEGGAAASKGLRTSLGVTSAPSHNATLKDLFDLCKNALAARRPDMGALVGSITPLPGTGGAGAGAAGAPQGLRAVIHHIIHLPDEKPVGCELLVRGPAGLLENPATLFSAARDIESLAALDVRCLRTCCDAARTLPPEWRCHVNLFPSTLLQLPTDDILATIARAGRAMCVEVSEDRFIGDPAVLAEKLQALRDNGVQVAIDDLGFGRSSLEVLLVTEPDVVKLDRRFVDGIAQDRERARLLRRFVAVIRGSGALAIAEGVSDPADRDLLIDMGLDHAQGYLWGRPQ